MLRYFTISLSFFLVFFLFVHGFLPKAEATVVVPAQASPGTPQDTIQLRTFGYATLTPVPPPDSTGSNASTSGGTITGDAQSLARQILANKNIKLLNDSRKDIQAVVDGRKIQNSSSCGNAVTVHPVFLKLMLELAKNHTYDVWNIVSLHGCDRFNHPRGRAMDIGKADGMNSWQNSRFRQDAANLLPPGGGLGQLGCPGSNRPSSKNKISQFADKCNHQHIDIGTQVK